MPDPITNQPTPEELNAAMHAATVSSGQIPTEIKTATGQVFRGATPQELLDQMRNSVENGSTHIKNLNDQLAANRAEMERMRLEYETRNAPPPPPPGQPDTKTQFYTEFINDPIKALEFGMAQTLGIEPDQVRPAFQKMVQTTDESNQVNQANEFLRHVPEFPRTQHATDLLVKTLEIYKWEPTWNNMVAAWNDIVHSGLAQPANVPITQNTVQPPPMLQGSSAPASTAGGFDMGRFANLRPEQQRQVIDEMFSRGAR